MAADICGSSKKNLYLSTTPLLACFLRPPQPTIHQAPFITFFIWRNLQMIMKATNMCAQNVWIQVLQWINDMIGDIKQPNWTADIFSITRATQSHQWLKLYWYIDTYQFMLVLSANPHKLALSQLFQLTSWLIAGIKTALLILSHRTWIQKKCAQTQSK